MTIQLVQSHIPGIYVGIPLPGGGTKKTIKVNTANVHVSTTPSKYVV